MDTQRSLYKSNTTMLITPKSPKSDSGLAIQDQKLYPLVIFHHLHVLIPLHGSIRGEIDV